MFLPDGRAIGVVRQGATFRQDGVLEEGVEAAGDGSCATGRPAGDRAGRDADAPLARAVQTRTRPGALGTGERGSPLGSSSHKIWHLTSFNTVTDLGTFMSTPDLRGNTAGRAATCEAAHAEGHRGCRTGDSTVPTTCCPPCLRPR